MAVDQKVVDAPFPVPEVTLTFAPAPTIRDMADGLIEEHKELEHLTRFSIDYLWKKKGGKRLSKLVYADAQITGALLQHYSSKTFVVWMAADNCSEGKLSSKQMEALVFSQLLRLGEDPKRGGPRMIAPDFQGYKAELEAYGTWNDQLRSMGQLLTQLGIFDQPAGEETPTPIR